MNATGKLLLVWEEVPESVKMFSFDEGTDMAELAVASANKYINSDDLPDSHPIFVLNERLSELSPLERTGIAEGPFSRVVICGFYL